MCNAQIDNFDWIKMKGQLRLVDFSNIDVEKLVVAWEEEDLWNISGENYHTKKCTVFIAIWIFPSQLF
jgi:hypothetical protein